MSILEVGGSIRATSDSFFATNSETFDLIFIDGLHTYEQVRKDIINSLNVLNKGGAVVLHDCIPLCCESQYRARSHDLWNGDVWKAMIEVRTWSHNEKVYISRSRLPSRLRLVVGEQHFEELLRAQGWRIVHPQELSILNQLATIARAKVVAGHLGSAFHSLMYLGCDFAEKTVIALGMLGHEQDSSLANYVFQFRHQPIALHYICCLRFTYRSMRHKAMQSNRCRHLRFAFAPDMLARRVEEIASQATQ